MKIILINWLRQLKFPGVYFVWVFIKDRDKYPTHCANILNLHREFTLLTWLSERNNISLFFGLIFKFCQFYVHYSLTNSCHRSNFTKFLSIFGIIKKIIDSVSLKITYNFVFTYQSKFVFLIRSNWNELTKGCLLQQFEVKSWS